MTNLIIIIITIIWVSFFLFVLPHIIIYGLPASNKLKQDFKDQDPDYFFLNSLNTEIIVGSTLSCWKVRYPSPFFKYTIYNSKTGETKTTVRGSKFSKYLDDLYILLEKENRIK